MINKFQQGGQADQDQQLNVLAQAMVQLQQLAAASEQGDQQAQAIMQEIQKRAQVMAQQTQQPAMAKCGTKLKRKEIGGVIQDKCGAKMKKKEIGGIVQDKCGSKMKKKEIGGAMKPCNCKKRLARIGGKLANVVCNGNIVK